jgi:succinoglycan biosynthesis transport protein ExoP
MNPQTSSSSEASLHAVDYWQVIKNRYGVILLTLALVFMTAAVITYVMPKKYESSALVQVRPKTAGRLVLDPTSKDLSAGVQTQQFFQTEFQVIRSRNVMSLVADSLQLMNKWGMDRDNVVRTLQGIVDAENTRNTDLIAIKVRHTNKEDARDIADEVAKAYAGYRTSEENREIEEGLKALQKAVVDHEDIVSEKWKTLNQIVQNTRFIPSGENTVFLNGNPTAEGMEAMAARETVTKLEQNKSQLTTQIDGLLNYSSDQLLIYAVGLDLPENITKTLYPEYLAKQRVLGTLKSQGLGSRHPLVQAQTEELAKMKRQLDEGIVGLRETLKAQLDLAERNYAVAKKLSAEKDEELVKRSITSQDYLLAKDDYERAQAELTLMKNRHKMERIQADLRGDVVKVHENAILAQGQVSPKVMLNLILGAVVGLVFGVGIAFFLEYLDTSVKSLEDVERYLQVPVLAVVPKDVGVLHKQSGMSPDAEAYRILRTNIEFNRKNPEDNAITVVSGGAGEGKSTTLVNLAYICAQGGYTTLMIDADLRRPRLHTFFDINNSVGLTNYLTTELMLEDVILQTPVDNLYFMPSGILPSDAAGILNSRRMSELIQDVKQRFDLVLVDSPPILGVSDASVLASEVDLTMIVVQHRKLPRNMLIRVKRAVEDVGGHVIGVVLNNVDVRSDSQYQYYTSYYTYYAPAESQPTVHSPAPAPAPARGPGGGKSESELY